MNTRQRASLCSVRPSCVDAIDCLPIFSRVKAVDGQQRGGIPVCSCQGFVVVDPQIIAEPHDCGTPHMVLYDAIDWLDRRSQFVHRYKSAEVSSQRVTCYLAGTSGRWPVTSPPSDLLEGL